jgi:hypothetical protein
MTADTERELTIETAELGHTFTERKLEAQCRAIVGGIAWPGKRPGYGVILALDVREFWPGGHMILLDEVDSWDLGELIRRCAALSLKYKPKFWVGDQHNAGARQLIMDNRADGPLKDFYIHHSSVLDMPQAYPYMLATLKGLLQEDTRRLFLKASKVLADLGAIVPEEVPYMEIGEYPGVEALSFVVCELQDDSRWRPQREQRRYETPTYMRPLGL